MRGIRREDPRCGVDAGLTGDAVASAHRRLYTLLAELGDERLRGPSLLPGWTRAHVLAHLADNARAFERQTQAALRGDLVEMHDGGWMAGQVLRAWFAGPCGRWPASPSRLRAPWQPIQIKVIQHEAMPGGLRVAAMDDFAADTQDSCVRATSWPASSLS
ncbi:maleylpyruvate isomerase N-terminal domain-containing protein [Actinoplanes regularis]|uniref:maleylpyruvate isomerase N-terminal domain-containing protein n=1 Tax=Actinoplanes regularis TaxID=52697 RepID=UPI003D7F68D0